GRLPVSSGYRRYVVCDSGDRSIRRHLAQDPLFFFSSRRRHTRFKCDWSSDVCSSDLGRVRTYRGGRLVAVDPFENPQEVRLPGGAAVTAIPIGSTEPLTLPRRNRGLKSVSVLMAILPRQLNDLLRERAREIAGGRSDPAKATVALLNAIAADPDRWLKGPTGAPSDCGMMATANETK